MDKKELISLKTLSERTKIGLSTLYRLIKSDGLPVYKIGKKYRIFWEDFLEWLKKYGPIKN